MKPLDIDEAAALNLRSSLVGWVVQNGARVIMDPEITRLRLLLAERDKMIDELLALLNEMTDKLLANVKEQHQRLVFNIENRTPVD